MGVSRHDVWFCAGWYLPTAHSTQPMAPSKDKNDPGGHMNTAELPSLRANVPITAIKQLVCVFAGWYLPPGHKMHAVDPVMFENVPL